jgi:hypothetical protein
MLATPECPECGAKHEAAPDAFGVCSCSDCGVSFRPPARVPIRTAGNSEVSVSVPSSTASRLIAVAAVIGLAAAVAVIVGDSQAPSSAPPVELPPIQIDVPSFDPNTLTPFAPVALTHEVHLSRVVDGEWLVTGHLHNPEGRELLSVALTLRFIDDARAPLSMHEAAVSCHRIAAHGTCAWAVDARVPAGMVDFELDAAGQPNWIGDVFESLELRREFDAAGQPLTPGDELELDVHEQTIRVRVPDDVRVFDVWATLTCLDADGRVLNVLETRWAESLSGETFLAIALPQGPSRFDLRVGGTVMPSDLVLPMLPP